MSHYPIEELIARWKNEELSVEQVIGQMLQVLKELERRPKEQRPAEPTPGTAAPPKSKRP